MPSPLRPRIFGEDRANHGIGDRDAQAGEEIGQRRGQPRQPEYFQARRAHRGEQGLDVGVGRLITLSQRHQHGKESNERDQHDLRREAEAEPQYDQRRDGDQRQGLAEYICIISSVEQIMKTMMSISLHDQKHFSFFLIVTILFVASIPSLTNFVFAEDGKNKKPQTLDQICSTFDDKYNFKSLVCVAVLGITNSIQNLQNQINHIQLIPGPPGPPGTIPPQFCPAGQFVTGFNSQGQIVCATIANPILGNQVTVVIVAGAGASPSAACVATNNCFSPNPITIALGTTIIWQNADSVGHTVTSGKITDTNPGSLFDSGLVKPESTFQFTFTNAGTYYYFDAVHPWITGQVIVK